MSPKSKQLLVRTVLSVIFVGIGVTHFTNADEFVANSPPYLPAPGMLVFVSGIFEILGGLGIWAPWQKLRRFSGYGIVALLISVYIVNIDMALHGSPLRGGRVIPGGSILLWLRLPLQFVMMWMAMYATRELAEPEGPATESTSSPSSPTSAAVSP